MTRLFVVVPFRQLASMFLGLCLVFAGGAALAVGVLHFPAVLLVVAISVDAILLLFAVPAVGYVFWVNVADMEDILTGEPWAHWTYTEDEWRVANRLESRRELGVAIAPALLVVAGLVIAVVGLFVPGGNQWAGIGVLMAVLGALIALVLAGTGTGIVGRRRSHGEVYVNRHGVYRRPGGYIPLTSARQRLDSVVLADAGGRAYLTFTTIGDRRRRAEVTRVLVPDGQLDRATLVAHWFGTYLADG